MDFLVKCLKTGLIFAEVPLKYAALIPLKAAAWLAPDMLLALMLKVLSHGFFLVESTLKLLLEIPIVEQKSFVFVKLYFEIWK